MNTLKKLFSLCLALTLLLSLAVPVSAAGESGGSQPSPEAAETYTITINGTSSGHNYRAYQIFKGRMTEVEAKDNNGNTIKDENNQPIKVATLGIDDWGDNLNAADFLAALKSDNTFKPTGADANVFAGASSASAVASVITTWTKGSNNLRRFAEIAASNVKGDGVEPTVDGNKYTFQLDSGYYLFMDMAPNSGTIDYYTELMLEVVQNETVTPKGDVPSVTKLVTTDVKIPYKETISATGIQEFIFRLEGDLPTNYDDYESYCYEFQDYLGAGMVFVENSVSVLIDHKAADAVDTVVTTGFTSHYDPTSNELSVAFSNLKPIATLQSDKVVITYKAKLAANKANANGTGGYKVGNSEIPNTEDLTLKYAGNVNRVRLKYSNDPNFEDQLRYGYTTEDTASVFTYGLQIKKIDGATRRALPGAKFILYRYTVLNATDTTNSTPSAQASETKEYAVFKSTGELDHWTTELKNTSDNYVPTVLTTGADGTVTVYGLSNATYHLQEIEAPAGYNKLDYDPMLTISPIFTEDMPAKLSALNYTLNLTEDGTGNVATGIVTIEITNSAGQTLPSTGGMGTTLFYAAGGILVVLAIVLLVTKKRMHNN